MSALSDFAEGEFLKHLFRTGSWTKPTVLAFALYTAAPGEAGGGTEVTNAGAYARVTLNPADANWDAPASGDGHTQNAAAITYAAPIGNWGVATHMGCHDSATHGGGNLFFYGALAQAKTINNGDAAPSYPIGNVDFTIA